MSCTAESQDIFGTKDMALFMGKIAIHVNNMEELAKAIQPVLLNMVDKMADRVHEALIYFLHDYYSGYEPSSYQRSKDFLFSAVLGNLMLMILPLETP